MKQFLQILTVHLIDTRVSYTRKECQPLAYLITDGESLDSSFTRSFSWLWAACSPVLLDTGTYPVLFSFKGLWKVHNIMQKYGVPNPFIPYDSSPLQRQYLSSWCPTTISSLTFMALLPSTTILPLLALCMFLNWDTISRKLPHITSNGGKHFLQKLRKT